MEPSTAGQPAKAEMPIQEGNPTNTSNAGPAVDDGPSQAVRFASVNQEIEPQHSLQSITQISDSASNQLSPQAEEEIRSLALGLHKSHIQQQRMSNFAFEPISIPVSRVQSHESSPHIPSREQTKSSDSSPRHSKNATPSLTPSGSNLREAQAQSPDATEADSTKPIPGPSLAGSQSSGLKGSSQALIEGFSSSAATSRPDSPSEGSTPPTSKSQESSGAELGAKSEPFQVGASNSRSSTSISREQSPSHEGGSGSVTPGGSVSHARPFTPAGEHDDPYARSKRPPQSKNLDSIDARFKFGKGDQRRRSGIGLNSASGSTGTLPRSNSGTDLKNEHRQSNFSLHSLGGGKKEHMGDEKHHGSMSELKRFFFGGHSKSKRTASPSSSAKRKTNTADSGTKTPPHQAATASVPFADDHGLVTKYGRFGKMLGSGAGGSVRLMKRSSDGTTFAVKQFRERHTYESERDYNKKVTAEFCIGSTLHHGNIIETLDIIHEGGKWYEVMEYAPFDLFAIVMTGKMHKEEVNCCFLQIVAGVAFLHSMGLTHRDLKLDNVVVNSEGIMKLIDFGSASVFRYPFENDVIQASGVVGSDPYLAPEVYDNAKYDPQPTDIWSLAIIYACMALRRFPWKAPRLTDNSYRLFALPPSAGTPGGPEAAKERSRSAADLETAGADEHRSSSLDHAHSGHHHHHHHGDIPTDGVSKTSAVDLGSRIDTPKQEVIKGPWRLLRLLPRETRSVVGRMLEINPKDRATLEEMLADPWVKDSPVCQQVEGGKIVRAGIHHHTLEPGSSAPPAK